MRVILFNLFLVVQCYSVLSDDRYNLKQLIVIARHGDRKPVYYPNDPYKEYWKKVPQLQLTKNGIKRSFKVGEEVRRAYKSFLPTERDQVYAKSQDSDVCLETAETILAAAFPPQGSSVWNPELNWQPFAVHTQPLITDSALTVYSRCPVAEDAQNKLVESKQVSKFIESDGKFLDFLSEKSGLQVNNIIAINALYDTLSTEKDAGLKLPNWVTDEVFDHLKTFSDFYMTIISSPVEIKRLRGGPLLKLIVDRLSIVNRPFLLPLMKKFSLYSTQGQIVSTLLNALNVHNQLSPPISAVILFELHQNDENNQYFVKLSYFNETSIDLRYTLYLPDCYYQEMCPLNLFIEICDKIIPKNWEEECQLPNDSKNKNKNSSVNTPSSPNFSSNVPLGNLPGFPNEANAPNSSSLTNVPKSPKGNSKSGNSSKKKNKNSKMSPNIPHLPTNPKQNNVLKAVDSQPIKEANKAILIIPILGYMFLGIVIVTLISAFTFFVLKLRRRSRYEIV